MRSSTYKDEQVAARDHHRKVAQRLERSGGEDPHLPQPLGRATPIALGVDRDAETFRSYMVASGNRALPTTFIIGGDGFVEWVGTGEEIDEVLKKVHHGTWDRDAFAKRYAGILKAYNDFPKLQQLLQRGELEEAEKLLAELKPLADSRMLVNLEAIEQRMKAATARK